MINATEANTNSKARIEKFAKEFIWNEVSQKVHSAIDGGWFQNLFLQLNVLHVHLMTILIILIEHINGFKMLLLFTNVD